MNGYEAIKAKSTKVYTRTLRNLHNVNHRTLMLRNQKEFFKLLADIEKDYPRATTKEIYTIAVNRLRHDDQDYRDFIRSCQKGKLFKPDRKEYDIQYMKAMRKISLNNMLLDHEVNRQIFKKIIKKEIEPKKLTRIKKEDMNQIRVSYLMKGNQ